MKKFVIGLVLLASAAVAQPAHAALLGGGSSTPAACSAGYVNLSFDDSPTQYTPVLLSTLKNNGLKATFFVVGDRATQYPTYVKSMVTAGMQVENHTQSHADLQGAPSPTHDLVTTQYLLIQQSGLVPTFYRPPYGSTNPEVSERAKELGLTEVIWTVDTNDWASPSTSQIVADAATVQPGGFILMHDGYPNTINAIPQIASMLKSRGLCAGKIVTSTTPTQAWEGLSFYATVAKF